MEHKKRKDRRSEVETSDVRDKTGRGGVQTRPMKR